MAFICFRKGFPEDFDLHRPATEHALQLADATFSFLTSELPTISASKTTAAARPSLKSASPAKQIGRNAMTANRRYRFFRFETLLKNCGERAKSGRKRTVRRAKALAVDLLVGEGLGSKVGSLLAVSH